VERGVLVPRGELVGSAPSAGDRGDVAPRRPTAALARFWSAWRPSLVTAAAALAAFRVLTLLVGLVAAYGNAGWRVLLQHPADALFLPFAHWDAGWWTRIVAEGYGHSNPGGFSDGAFAPGYPMAIRAVMWLLHVGPLVAGFLVSGVALFVALAVLHRLAAEDHGLDAARTTVLLVLVWPTAAFLAAPYSEPLSLALVSLALLAARRQRWVWAGLLAAAAMLSKYVLGLLVIALLVDHVVRRRRRDAPPQARTLAAIALPGCLALAGVLAFMQVRFGAPLHFLTAEGQAWGHRLTTPLQLALNAHHEIVSASALGALPQLRTFLIDDATILGLAVLAGVMLWRHRRHPAEAALVAVVAATFLCMSGPDSVSRYALVLAPMFLVLGPALARRGPLRTAVLGCSAALMAVQLVTFTANGWAG